ncbi:NUDIX domain-containing protein [Halomonas sp. ML-15]|uniref:NUDIX hydrolase n=1 Tax=Halomonas sp. ML-15 TaxID=2773305 RepID=UPI001746F117|nr:NUDIX domain-containing protein [Halomonas sp. ML-15]MBD3896887.1 NUDIX domain-containing protein [Halomonas sp. ML-15]
MHNLGAFAVILDDVSRVLLCHRRDFDAWNLPGGKVEPLEAPWKAAQREVLEEVGLIVRVERLVGVYSVPEQETVVFTFLCTGTGGAISLSDEADDIQWFHKDHLPSNTLPRHVQRIQDAFSRSGCALLCVQAE